MGSGSEYDSSSWSFCVMWGVSLAARALMGWAEYVRGDSYLPLVDIAAHVITYVRVIDGCEDGEDLGGAELDEC